MHFFVYILLSEKTGKYYIGQTKDITKRLMHHNSGYNKSTKYGAPWELVFTKVFSSRPEAVRFETKLKKAKNKKYLEKIISNHDIKE